MDIASHYLDDIRAQFRKQKTLAEGAIAQLPEADLFRALDDESNSVAIMMRHVGGNLRSRFTDFLTTDGEKPDRDRDGEFEVPGAATREAVVAGWDLGFATLFAALDGLAGDDLARAVTIRGEPYTVMQALDLALTHLAHHVGQIVFLTKHLRGSAWRTLSQPRRRAKKL